MICVIKPAQFKVNLSSVTRKQWLTKRRNNVHEVARDHHREGSGISPK